MSTIGFGGFFDTSILSQNVTHFFSERIQDIFLEKQQETLQFDQVVGLVSERYQSNYVELMKRVPSFIWSCAFESFMNETGSNAVIACFFFVSAAVISYMVLVRPIINYLFRIDLDRTVKQVKQDLVKEGVEFDNASDLSIHPIRLDRNFVDWSIRVFRKDDQNNVLRKIFEVSHYLISLMMLLVFIPYTRLENYWTWMCYWSYCGMAFFVTSTTVKRFRGLRRFALRYIFFPSQGLMMVSNFAYIYYDLVTWQFGYVFVHFVPPVVMWIFILLNIREFVDSDFNYSTGSTVLNAYNLMFYLVVVTYWRYVFNPLIIYSRVILDVFLWACLLPSIFNALSFALISLARKIWFDRHAKRVIRDMLLKKVQ